MVSMDGLKGKRVLVTGIAGTVGTALAEALCKLEIGSLVGIDNSESGLFNISRSKGIECEPVLADVRDKESLNLVLKNIDVVFHLAALKHVPLCEKNPVEAIKTNIHGVNNVIDGALKNDVEKVVNTSTDKAVNPFNVMGTSKLMGEQLVRAANIISSSTVFSSIRFGNVLGSSGSVIPIFKSQLASGQPLTLTSKDMTRFVMTLGEAIDLVLESMLLATGGETFVTKMKTIRVEMLAEVMMDALVCSSNKRISYAIDVVGLRPGEKLFEELMTSEEARRSKELDHHYVIMPALSDIYLTDAVVGDEVVRPYNSSTQSPMEKEELRNYLVDNLVI